MRLAARSSFFVMAIAASGMVACGGGGDDDGTTIEGDHHTYVVDEVTIPLDQGQAEDLGFDLDGDCAEFGDALVDNQLGNILSALATQGGDSLDLQGSITESVNDGTILLLADIQATALNSASGAGFRLFLGENPSPAPCTNPDDPATCRQHLMGDGSFDVSADSPTDLAIAGNIAGGRFSGGPGELALQIAFGDTTINLTLVEARAEVNGITADSLGESKVGGAVPNSIVQGEVIPAVHVAITDILLEDCGPVGDRDPAANCSCVADSTGDTLMGIFDEDPVDCDVGLEELRNNSLIETLLRPDIDTDCNGEDDALSVGVGATAVAGTYTVPE